MGSESSTPPLTHSSTFLAWLRLFRVVNLPTVPGDVLVGAAAVACSLRSLETGLASVWWAASASVFLYMFGLVQNDIMGAKTDKDRPIPNGEISMDSAWAAAAVCLAAAFGCAYMGGLLGGDWMGRCSWPWGAIVLVGAITVYNRWKSWWVMGFCRAMNVMLGVAAVVGSGLKPAEGVGLRPICVAVLWWLYISLVTLYSKGEENDPEKKRRVGLFVGGIVYLQLAALLYLALQNECNMPLLVAGAVLLVVLRLFKSVFPKVSAS